MKYYFFIACLAFSLILINCKSTQSSKVDHKPQIITTPSGLQYIDIKVGDGDIPKIGQKVIVHYVSSLENGNVFDNSRIKNKPYKFTVGANEVIKGWDEGIQSMRVGGIRKLIIPPELAWGNRSMGDEIPANSTIIIEVELIGIEK